MSKFLSRALLGACACLALPVPAVAHVTLQQVQGTPNASYRGVVQVNHGCKGSPTVSVRVTIPEGIVGVRPMPKPGWTLAISKGPYARNYSTPHGAAVEGVKEIVWSGGSLPDDQFDEFVFVGRITDAFKPGESVAFPVVQTCESGSHDWTEVAAGGQSARDLKAPAPLVRIVAAAAGSRSLKAGDLTIEAPWLRATPGSAKVAGGYVRIANGGREPDRLVGASIPLAGRGEVHEMTVTDGIMKMRPIESGLPIPPGGSVELKPGGLHLMFLDLRTGLKPGEEVQGTLVFEKAGTVAVTFPVAAIGAQAPDADHQH
jgi:periplasmic copper chaperone A